MCKHKSISKQPNGDKPLEATNNNKMNSFLLISPNNKSKSSIASHNNSILRLENQQKPYNNINLIKPGQLAI